MKQAILFLRKILVYAFVVVVCFEIALRILGYGPYRNSDYKVEASPANAFIGDEKLGIALNPGSYKIVLNDKIRFQTTHTNLSRRLVPQQAESDSLKMAFLGCSFTYGYGVNDKDNFVSKIQNSMPNWRIDNYATPGFGTVQSYLQLQEILKENDTKVVVLCFSDFHFIRNVMSHIYRSNLKIGFRNSSKDVDTRMEKANFPYIPNSDLKVQYNKWDELYSNYYLREYLASSNWMQTNVDKFKDRNLNSVNVTVALLLKMKRMCDEKDVEFVVFCLDNSFETRQLQKSLNFKNWKNIHFNFGSKSLTNRPYDSHPNAKGHSWMAKKMIPFLKNVLIQSE